MLTRKNLLLPCLLTVFGYLSINAGLPAYPFLQHVFETDEQHIKLTISLFLLAYGVSQLYWGPLSDHFGRRPILFLSVAIAAGGSVIVGLSTNITTFIIGRIIEGVGAGCGLMLARALLADTLEAKDLHCAMPYIIMIAAVMPAIAPIIGGHLLHWFYWQSIFFFLALFGCALLLYTLFFYEETHPPRDHVLSIVHVTANYLHLFSHRLFLGYFLAYIVMLAGLVTFYMVSPYLFINHLHMPPKAYGYFLGFVGGGYLFGTFMTSLLARRISARALLLCGYGVAALSMMGFFYSVLMSETLDATRVLVPMMLYAISCGFISPTSNSSALAAVPTHRGSAAALLGGGAVALASLGSAILSFYHMTTLLPLACYLGVSTLTSGLLFYCLSLKADR